MILLAGGATLLAAAGLALVSAAVWPLPDLSRASPVVAEAGLRAGAATADLPPLSDFEPAWQVNLRRPLTDTAGASDTTSPGLAIPSGPNVRLVGTIIPGG